MGTGHQELIESSLTPDEANRIIHSHRKVRYSTACWPCRKRKVKCDTKQPCKNCVRKDHPNLCSYNTKRNGDMSTLAASIPRVKRGRSPESENSLKREDGRRPRTTDDQSQYLGQDGVAALLNEESRARQPSGDGDHDDIRRGISTIVGIQISSEPYPFMSKDHMDRIQPSVAAALPSEREVLKTFHIYCERVHPFWGLLIDIEDFESKLCTFLEHRDASARHPASNSAGVSSAWLGMLFGVLAVATNYSELSYEKRVATSQTFVQTSFHCLRLSNFLVRPSLESLQALLILGFVLANDMKTEASWALLGLTCRLAQSLGLHRGLHENAPARTPAADDLPRRKLWWTIVWQDSLLSLLFDRSPIAVMTQCQLPLRPSSMTEGFSYTEAMYHLCQKVIQYVDNDITSQPDFDQIIAGSVEVENIRQQVYPRLRLKDACKTMEDRLQHYALRLYTSFVISVLCRPALRRRGSIAVDLAQKRLVAEKCKQNLVDTVRMYLKLHSLSGIYTRSWAVTYHALSSAVLLGNLGETKADPEVRELQGDLISALSATAVDERGPLSTTLAVLRHSYNHG